MNKGTMPIVNGGTDNTCQRSVGKRMFYKHVKVCRFLGRQMVETSFLEEVTVKLHV
jgi:hypothetical protein